MIAKSDAEGVESRLEKEIESSDCTQAEYSEVVMRMEEAMSQYDPPPPPISNQQSAPPMQDSSTPALTQQSKVKAKLPKLEVKKFSGRIQDWQEFWDSLQSSIHLNKSLSAVDKFSYLKCLVQEPPRSTIGGCATIKSRG